MEATVEKTELEEAFEVATAALAEFGEAGVYVSRQVGRSFRDSPIRETWQVMAFPAKGSIASASSDDFGKALAEVVSKLHAELHKCQVCGGRMDGACAHKHD